MNIRDAGRLFAERIVPRDRVSEFYDPLITETESGFFHLLWIDKVPNSAVVMLSLKS